MTKYSNNNDKANREDKAIRNLIRATIEDASVDFVCPSAESIYAYLKGIASDDQRAEVQTALIKSASFRKELLTLAEDLEYLATAEAAKNFHEIHVSKIPKSIASLYEKETAAWGKVIHLVKSRYLIPATAVFFLVFFLLIFKPFKFELKLDQEAVAGENTLAVMYFENLVNRSDPQRIGEIMTNLLIADLSESHYVKVISPQRLYDILRLEQKENAQIVEKNMAFEIAERTEAKWMLLGSIVQVQPRFRVTFQIVEVETDRVLASQHVSGDPGDAIFSMVDHLTAAIKKDLLLPPEAASETDPPVVQVTTTSEEAYRYYVEGLNNLYKLDRDRARESFQRAIDLDSTFAMAYAKLTHPHISRTKAEVRWAISKALQYSDRISRKERYYINSRDAYLSGNLRAAIDELKALLEDYADEKDAYIELGWIYSIRGNLPDAVSSYKRAIKLDPLEIRAYNRLAYLYRDAGNMTKAFNAVNKYIRLDQDEPNPYDTRGDLYASVGRIDEAIESYKMALARDEDFFPSIQNLANKYLLKRNYEKAKQYYQRLLLAEDPGARSRARVYLACVQIYQGKLGSALEKLEQGKAADLLEEYRGEAYIWKMLTAAFIYSELDDSGSAVTEAKKLVEIREDSPEWFSKYIYFLAASGDFEKAYEVLDHLKAIIKQKDDPPMHFYWQAKGWIAFKQGDLEEALTAFQRAQKVFHEFDTRFALAKTYLKLGRFDEVIEILESVLRDYSDDRIAYSIWDVKAHYVLAIAYEESGRLADAAHKYEEFIDIWNNTDFESTEVNDAKRRLAMLKKRRQG